MVLIWIVFHDIRLMHLINRLPRSGNMIVTSIPTIATSTPTVITSTQVVLISAQVQVSNDEVVLTNGEVVVTNGKAPVKIGTQFASDDFLKVSPRKDYPRSPEFCSCSLYYLSAQLRSRLKIFVQAISMIVRFAEPKSPYL